MNQFSTTWKSSVQPRKQHKYRYNAPLHLRQKFVHVHLSADLRKKHGKRNLQVKKGDKVKIMRGQFAKKEGMVERVNLKREQIFVTGIEIIKKDGSKVPFPLSPSNLLLVELNLDKRRKAKLERKEGGKKEGTENRAQKKVGAPGTSGKTDHELVTEKVKRTERSSQKSGEKQ